MSHDNAYKQTTMPKQVSALNTFWIIEFLREHHPDAKPQDILKSVNRRRSYYVENLKTGQIEQVSLEHLTNTEYWFSNRFMIRLYDALQSTIPDPNLAYKIGRTSYRAQPILKTAIGAPLLGPMGVLKRIAKENSKYNRTKDISVVKVEKGHVILRLIHHDGIITNRFAMEWHRGVFEAYAALSGAKDVEIALNSIDEEKGIYDFDILFKAPSFFSRLLSIIVFNIPIVKDVIEKAEAIQVEHNEQILNRDRIIRERTKQLSEEKAKVEKAHKILTRYVSSQLARKILDGDIKTIWGHHRKKLTIFFSDIRDFTRTTDSMEPEDMAKLLNEYFTHMYHIIVKHEGTLANIIGDALFVFYGAPDATNDKDQALRCVRMAIEMQLEMRRLQKKWFEEGVESPLQIRCGINTGMATVGGFGSAQRKEYTAMGMQVNLASRLESSCQPGEILISHTTWAFIKDEIECEEKGQIEVKGFHRPIRTYKVLFE